MIPPFNEYGYLPPGVHLATIEEIEERFGRANEIRQAQMESLRWLIDLARKAGVRRLIVNGSFVTAIAQPNDVDCVALADQNTRSDPSSTEQLWLGLPFVQLELLEQSDFDLGCVGKLVFP